MHGFFMDIRLYHKVKEDDACKLSLLPVKCASPPPVEDCVCISDVLFTFFCLIKGKNDGQPLCL